MTEHEMSKHVDAIKELAQPWVDYLRPAMEDDNNYYRGQCQLDGKDAAGIGEDFEAVMQHADVLAARLAAAEAERDAQRAKADYAAGVFQTFADWDGDLSSDAVKMTAQRALGKMHDTTDGSDDDASDGTQP